MTTPVTKAGPKVGATRQPVPDTKPERSKLREYAHGTGCDLIIIRQDQGGICGGYQGESNRVQVAVVEDAVGEAPAWSVHSAKALSHASSLYRQALDGRNMEYLEKGGPGNMQGSARRKPQDVYTGEWSRNFLKGTIVTLLYEGLNRPDVTVIKRERFVLKARECDSGSRDQSPCSPSKGWTLKLLTNMKSYCS